MRMIGMNADITVWKDTEAQLLESYGQLRALAGRLINAQEEERRRVSHELHDDLNQGRRAPLAISRLRRLASSHQEIIPHLNDLYNQTNELSNDIRQLSHRLHPATLEHLGLAEALKTYIGEFETETGIITSFAAHITSETIASEISVCLYRIALEALRNVARHSQAKSASVLLEAQEQVLTMKVEDSGIGFNIEAARRGSGLGLISAEESVNLLQGTFEVASVPAMGTRLTAKIPLR
jgi:signal transduction histidine kinase